MGRIVSDPVDRQKEKKRKETDEERNRAAEGNRSGLLDYRYYYYYRLPSVASASGGGDGTASTTVTAVGADRGTTWTRASGAPASAIIPSHRVRFGSRASPIPCLSDETALPEW